MNPDGAGPAGQDGSPRRWSGRPLRLRLTLLTAGLLCVTLALGALALTTVLSRGRVATLDEITTARANTIAGLATDDRIAASLPVAQPGEIAQLLDADGQVLASSPNASRTLPVIATAELDRLLGMSRDGEVTLTTVGTAYDEEVRLAALATEYRGEPATVVVTMPLAEVRDLLRALAISLVAIVPVLTLLLAWTIWLVLGRALRPVEELRRGAERVARTGGPGTLPVPRAEDELGALAQTLNEMLDALDAAAARQRTFVADAAHELRSPLASLRTSLDVAAAHPNSYSQEELVSDLGHEVGRMQALVEDLLLLSRLGSAPPRQDEVDLRELVSGAVRDARPGAQIAVEGAGRGQGDAVALTRVLRNLLDNAVRHADSAVRVRVSDGEVCVDDDGRGIPEADRERVFERFVRLDEARERDSGGAGLGLAIAREVARAQGGDVVITGSELGGARVVMRVPQAEER
ncbi:HAMP domain-containing histidine kinase [Ruania alkalisoli]|uniref:histidine kinase n=1 Tax=Ruania alkalisoli TaxID=2779775 RepID=A0A7M1SX20_9MICO|nr:HAMP domain-containing sensor histidine kinase [Ruania alkalisoli]QOR71282.1 HAMP domain-containing histidine kinase [Ruania alkalisoli]